MFLFEGFIIVSFPPFLVIRYSATIFMYCIVMISWEVWQRLWVNMTFIYNWASLSESHINGRVLAWLPGLIYSL